MWIVISVFMRISGQFTKETLQGKFAVGNKF